MKTMHGAFASACENRSRTRAAPTPTNISTNSDPLRLKNGTFASPATARASSVLPVPGRADEQHALRNASAERRVLLRGLAGTRRSPSAPASASSTPATSAKLTFTSSSAKTWCLLRANDMTPPSAPPMRRKKKLQTAKSSSSGMIQPRISGSQRLTNSPVYFTCARLEILDELRILDARGVEVRASPFGLRRAAASGARIDWSPTVTSATWPLRTSRLELAVGDRLPGRRQEPRLREREQQQQAEDLPDENAGARRPSGRRSPGFRSRGLMRGWVRSPMMSPKVWANGPGCGPAAVYPASTSSGVRSTAAFLNTSPLPSDVDGDPIAFAEVALEHAHRQRIEHAPLDRPLQRARAIRSDRSPPRR